MSQETRLVRDANFFWSTRDGARGQASNDNIVIKGPLTTPLEVPDDP